MSDLVVREMTSPISSIMPVNILREDDEEDGVPSDVVVVAGRSRRCCCFGRAKL